jgi:hypothetical protein
MGVPAIRVLLDIFIGQYDLKRSAMQVEVEYIQRAKSGTGKRADKELVDHVVPLDTDYRRRGGGTMRSYNHVHLGSSWCQRDGWTIVERSRHATFRMSTHLIW